MKARFSGNMKVENADPPNSYSLVGSGSASSAGAARGEVAIKLKSIAAESTLLEFDASVAIIGRLAQIGGKMINSTAEAFVVSLGSKRWLIAALTRCSYSSILVSWRVF